MARDLVARSPQGSIVCVFAGGSLARGEVWCAQIDRELEVYSDVDLYVVVEGEGALARVQAAVAAIATPRLDGVRFLRPPDIGVYTRADLAAQPARPGTIDLSVNHLLLHGDPSVPAGLRRPDPARMAPAEALYLLENRVAETAGADAGAQGSAARAVMVQALKARLDVHAAHTIVAGSFAPTLAARAKLFESGPPEGLDAAARDDVADAYHAARDPAAWFAGREAGAERERALRALVRAWCALAGGVLAPHRRVSIEEAVAIRCRAGARIQNARELVRLRRRTGLPAWRAVMAAPGLARVSPRAALRLDALVRRLHDHGQFDARDYAAHARYLDALTQTFGFADGSQEMRARTMHHVIS
jgi:hypothetical protein